MVYRETVLVFLAVIFFGLSFVPIKAELPFGSKNSNACDRILKVYSNREVVAQLSEKIKTFSSYVSRPEFAGKNLPEIMNQMGATLRSDPQLLQAFHKDFHQMMKVFDEVKHRSLTKAESQIAFAIISNQSILSRSFVTSFLIAQVTEKFLSDRSVVINQKYYSAEDADIVVFSALTATLRGLDNQDEDLDFNAEKNRGLTTSDLAKKLAESLVENSMHPDSLLGGTQILRDLFSKDPEIRAKSHHELNEKSKRSSHLREVFRKNWIEPNSNQSN